MVAIVTICKHNRFSGISVRSLIRRTELGLSHSAYANRSGFGLDVNESHLKIASECMKSKLLCIVPFIYFLNAICPVKGLCKWLLVLFR